MVKELVLKTNVRAWKTSIILVTLVGCLVSPSYGVIRYVDQTATNSVRDGSSWCSAFVTLDEALVVAVAGDTIRVAHGTYTPDPTGLVDPREATFLLVSGTTLEGSYSGCGAFFPDTRNLFTRPTILSGDLSGNDLPDFTNRLDNTYHVVTAISVNANTTLDGFMIVGGYANGPNFGPSPDSKDQGSGFNNYHGTPTVLNTTFADNFATNHGTFNAHGGATLENCEWRDNVTQQWASGLFVFVDITTTVRDCRFIDNTSEQGGGVYMRGPTDSTFTNCLF